MDVMKTIMNSINLVTWTLWATLGNVVLNYWANTVFKLTARLENADIFFRKSPDPFYSASQSFESHKKRTTYNCWNRISASIFEPSTRLSYRLRTDKTYVANVQVKLVQTSNSNNMAWKKHLYRFIELELPNTPTYPFSMLIKVTNVFAFAFLPLTIIHRKQI